MPRLLVVGDLLTDVTVMGLGTAEPDTDTPASVALGGGGGGGNVAAWAAALGVPTTFAGRVGADAWGHTAAALLAEVGVRLRVTPDAMRPTGTCVVLVGTDGRRDLVVSPGASTALDPADLPDPRDFDWVHLSGYPLLHEGSRTAAAGLLQAARTGRVPFSVDPASVAPLRRLGTRAFRTLVDGAAVLFPNAAEAALLTGCADPAGSARALLEVAAEVVVTCGADGAVAAGRSFPGVLRVPAAAVAGVGAGRVVDTTGAGDGFAAGWLAARLGGAGARGCLAAGAHTGAAVVTRVGTRPDG